MKNEIIEMNEADMHLIRGGDGNTYGSILAGAGGAAVAGAFILAAGPLFLVGLVVVGAAATFEGAYIAYNS